MIEDCLSATQLRSICSILADTYRGLTKSELERFLRESKIKRVDDGKRTLSNGMAYQLGLNKRDWLYNCFANEINSTNSFEKIYSFIINALNPINYTVLEQRPKYQWLREEINKVLLLIGLYVSESGSLIHVEKAKSLDEVDRRVNDLQKKLYDRAIHSEVTKYCIEDYLRKDYYDAVFESAKGLANRVREITGLLTDGSELFRTAFCSCDPFLFFNSMQTKSEISEFQGLKELLEAIFHLVRNPAAHTPKINWKADETKALDILTLISFAHKYLDECHKMPNK